MLRIDLKISNQDQVKNVIEIITGKWLRKDSDNIDKIIINLKHKRKKRLENVNTCYFKVDLARSSN